MLPDGKDDHGSRASNHHARSCVTIILDGVLSSHEALRCHTFVAPLRGRSLSMQTTEGRGKLSWVQRVLGPKRNAGRVATRFRLLARHAATLSRDRWPADLSSRLRPGPVSAPHLPSPDSRSASTDGDTAGRAVQVFGCATVISTSPRPSRPHGSCPCAPALTADAEPGYLQAHHDHMLARVQPRPDLVSDAYSTNLLSLSLARHVHPNSLCYPGKGGEWLAWRFV